MALFGYKYTDGLGPEEATLVAMQPLDYSASVHDRQSNILSLLRRL